jgi:hypothetical protein
MYLLLQSASLHSCYHFRLYTSCVTCILAFGYLLLWKLFTIGLSERKSFGTITCTKSAASAFSTVLGEVWLNALYIRTEI